jgi:SAM-dependent methyltransferase
VQTRGDEGGTGDLHLPAERSLARSAVEAAHRRCTGSAVGGSVPEYVLDHHQEGERQRLALMSQLLDPMHRRYIERLGIGPAARTLEVGCGNGSMSAWLAGQTYPVGQAVAVDLDLSLAEADVPGLEFRRADILAGPVGPADFDLVTARAVLHHVADAEAAVANLVASARPGGSVLLIEPDFLPVSIAEPAEIRDFWQGWLAWSREQGIDYFIGRRLPGMLSGLGIGEVEGTAETALYPGGSAWARYWSLTITQLRPRLLSSGKLDSRSIDAFLARCQDPAWWTQTIAFTVAHGRVAH